MGKNADGVIVIPKQLKNITDLYRSCQFEKADMLLEKLDKLPNQILSIKAQLAFFKWDFDRSVELILGYYDHLDEWYSANAQNDTILMLTFSLLKCSGDVKENAIKKLAEIYDSHSEKEKYIKESPRIIEVANGTSADEFAYNKYSAPANPKTLDEIIEIYKDVHKKECAKIKGRILGNQQAVIGILGLVSYMGTPEDYITLYEKVSKSNKLLMDMAMVAARIYRFLGKYNEARQAIINHVRYQWHFVEWTEVMPVSALVGFDCFDLYTEELFAEIYNTPKEVSGESKITSEKLKFKGNFDELFEQKEFAGFELNQVKISALTIISGKIIVGDPLVWLDENTKPFCQKVPKGEFDVIAQIALKDGAEPIITAVMVRFSETPAVVYRNAIFGDEALYEIENADDYNGFNVDGGLVAIVDEKVNKEFVKFRNQFEKKSKADFYNGCLAEIFEKSATDNPHYQRECGDFIDFDIPNTDHHIPVFASGAGNGYYPVYFGYDKKNNVCSMIVEFIETY